MNVCNARFPWPIFCISFLKEHMLHVHLRPNHFHFEFLKSTKFVINLIFPGSEF